MNAKTHELIESHYLKAIGKHSHFCKSMLPLNTTPVATGEWLDGCRAELRIQGRHKQCVALSILECEIAEAMDAYAQNNLGNAIDECYDAIAVLIRMIDWMRKGMKK